jgi:glutamate/aspartate transport system substrate-binding protein
MCRCLFGAIVVLVSSSVLAQLPVSSSDVKENTLDSTLPVMTESNVSEPPKTKLQRLEEAVQRALDKKGLAQTSSPASPDPFTKPLPVTSNANTSAAPAASFSPPELSVRLPVINTLKRLRQQQVIVLGYRESSIPLSYIDDFQFPIGFSMDICHAIVEAIRIEKALPKLKVRYVPVLPDNRLAALQQGKIDLECGSTTNNSERAQQVNFLTNVFATGSRLLVRADRAIRQLSDLQQQKIVVTKGTVSESLLQKLIQQHQWRITVVTALDHQHAFNMVQMREVDAFMMDEVLLAGLKASAKMPDDYVIVGDLLSNEAYSIMLRKQDDWLKLIGDRVIGEWIQSGQLEKLYSKWFIEPIPPQGVSLSLVPTASWQRIVTQPTDQPF